MEYDPALTGAELILAERERQIKVEGWTPQHDDHHDSGVLLLAALCYAAEAQAQIASRENDAIAIPIVESGKWWPWDQCWYKPAHDPIRNLEKAGALIAAEIDRLKRAKGEVV